MKKILFFIFLLLFPTFAYANYNDIYIADLSYDWINKNELEKEAIINEVQDIVFENPVLIRNDLKNTFRDKLKDKDYVNHYYAASAGHKEYKDYNLSAFYIGKFKSIYMYAIQDKKDLTKSYYYDAMGNLKYIDFIAGDYPDFPYTVIQYKISGKPVSAIYYISKDCQYLFKPNGEFEGVWYKHNLYNKHNKIILKRTTY